MSPPPPDEDEMRSGDLSVSRRSRPAKLVVYRCPACQSFVAASRDPKLIELAQRYHVCPESLAFASHNQQHPTK